MQRNWSVWIIMVAVLALVVSEGRTLAQDHARKTSAVGSASVGLFSLANTFTSDPGAANLVLLEGQSGFADADDVAKRQSMDSFTSLEDGQPGAPGALELQLDIGWSTAHGDSDTYTWETQVKYTGDSSDFQKNMKLALTVPFEVGDAGIDGNGDLEVEWQQRWVAENGDMPTLATIIAIRVPTGYQSDSVDGTVTGIIAKDFGPGTFFLNGWGKSANGNNFEDRRDFQWGGRFAYLWRFAEDSALTIDYVNQTSEVDGESNINLLELAAQVEINDDLILGPGVFFGVDGRDSTPDFGAGIRITYGF